MVSLYFHCSKTILRKIKNEIGNYYELLMENSDLNDRTADFCFIEYEFKCPVPAKISEKSINIIFSTEEQKTPDVFYLPLDNIKITIDTLLNFTISLRKEVMQKNTKETYEATKFDLLSRAIHSWSINQKMEQFLKNILCDEVKLINGAYGGSIWIKENENFVCAASTGLDKGLLKDLKFKEEEVFKSSTDEATVIVSKKHNYMLTEEKIKLIKKLGTFEKHITLVGNISIRGKLYGNICLDGIFENCTFSKDDINIHSFYTRIVSKFIEEKLMRQETKNLMKKLVESEKKFRTLSESTNSYIFIQQNGRIIYSNPSMKAMLEKEKAIKIALINKANIALKSSGDYENRGEFEIEVSGKSSRWFRFNFSIIESKSKKAILCHGNDITETKVAYEKIKYMALHDPMTDLYNRSYFEEEILRLKNPRAFPVSIFIADLNNMKITNDTYGHEKGDQLIKNTADVFKENFRSCDVIARIGGDEFAVILSNTDQNAAKEINERLIEKIKAFNINGDIKIDISIGYATQRENENIKSVLDRADSKMYEVKRMTKKTFINQTPTLRKID